MIDNETTIHKWQNNTVINSDRSASALYKKSIFYQITVTITISFNIAMCLYLIWQTRVFVDMQSNKPIKSSDLTYYQMCLNAACDIFSVNSHCGEPYLAGYVYTINTTDYLAPFRVVSSVLQIHRGCYVQK